MKKRVIATLICVSCLFLLLSGSSPKLISEDEAKKAGLAFINHVFDVNVSEVIVTKGVRAGATYVDGEYQETGNEQQITFYIVATPPDQYGQSDYKAFVNAETGVAYSAEKSYSLVPSMTYKEYDKWKKAYAGGDAEIADWGGLTSDCYIFGREWIAEKFDLKAGILGVVDSGCGFDNSGASCNFYIVIRDGSIYHMTVEWPQMTVTEITILNQTRPTVDMP